ncbi:HK97 gp10 family phage protein [Aquabacterium sp. A7-Y]|uniref:HK97-gp10 family putative phage morphogenesis protein n=1 Tax=Aquabacterium sp. A7-Y TaxID=1349605 RepID=UPI00223E716F|nr:HK97-gp10 family putative phage morphogenesis protein [Aquabacterium sp. A7-Y]MCW7542013.1 HK97 gp10 family phage protein [Aquabacterium sp. A7-Y]
MKGLHSVIDALRGLPDELRRKVLRRALAAGARVVRDEAKQHAPVLSNERPVPYRAPGTVQKAIAVRTSKRARRAGDVGVFVNVRPAKKGQRGATSPTDPFYWRWLEFGTTKLEGRGFLQKGGQRLGDALSKFTQVAGPAIQRLNRPK